jgi:hypothetical protein
MSVIKNASQNRIFSLLYLVLIKLMNFTSVNYTHIFIIIIK